MYTTYQTTLYYFVFLFFNTQLAVAQVDILIQEQAPIKEKWAILTKVLKNKKIVALGENYHGVKEYNAIKLEMIQYLHEEMGFNVLALEGDLGMSYFANAYRDSLTDTLILQQAVTPVWHTQHHLEMMAYLKAHPKLQLIGFDMITKRSVAFFAQQLGVSIDSSQATFQAFLEAYPQWGEVNGNREPYSPEKRDSTMASIVNWIAKELYPNEKIILSAHNYHIANDKPTGRVAMGTLLHQQHKKNYYSIGFYNSLGAPVHIFRDIPFTLTIDQLSKYSLQYQFLQKEGDLLFIPITPQKKNKENKWLHQDIYDYTSPTHPLGPLVLGESFDGLIWVRTVTAPDFVIESETHYRLGSID